MNPIFWVLVCGLAVWEIVEVIHHGTIFVALRKWCMDRLSIPPDTLPARVKYWFASLISCPFCLSVWVSLFCVLCLFSYWTQLIVLVFAVARLANICNDVGYAVCRTPRESHEPEEIALDIMYRPDPNKLMLSVNKLTLPIQVIRSLMESGCQTLEDLCRLTDCQLTELPMIEAKEILQIDKELERHGLYRIGTPGADEGSGT